MLTITHAETVAAYPSQFTEPCRIVPSGWPYECEAKRANPDHLVFVCEPHAVWWHRAPGIAHDFIAVPDTTYPSLVNPQCSCGGLTFSGYVKTWLAIYYHRQHRGEPARGEAWAPMWDGSSTGQDDDIAASVTA